MRDYKSPWNRNQLDDLDIRESNPIATLFWIVIFGMMLVVLLPVLFQAIDEEVTIREQQAKAAQYRPEAFRKGSPTHEQMWAMDHFVQVQEVMKSGDE